MDNLGPLPTSVPGESLLELACIVGRGKTMNTAEALAAARRIKTRTTNREIVDLCDYVINRTAVINGAAEFVNNIPVDAIIPLPKAPVNNPAEGYRAYMREYMRGWRARRKNAEPSASPT